MLDLTLIKEDYYEIRLADGTELHLKRPTQALFQFSMVLEGLVKSDKHTETMEAFTQLFARVLNRNIEGKTFEAEVLANEYDPNVMSYVIQDYFNFYNKEVDSKVNFLQNQQ